MNRSDGHSSAVRVTLTYWRLNARFLFLQLTKKTLGFVPNWMHRRTPPRVGVLQVRDVRYLHFGTHLNQTSVNLRDPYSLDVGRSVFMAFLLFDEAPDHVVMVGLGGGAVPRFVYRHLPHVKMTTIELLPEVVGVARAYFFIPEDSDRFTVLVQDGESYIETSRNSADVLIIDAYDGEDEVRTTTTRDFYHACARTLRNSGAFVQNLLNREDTLRSHIVDLRSVFPLVMCVQVSRYNVIVFALKEGLERANRAVLHDRARKLSDHYSIDFDRIVDKLDMCGPNGADDVLVSSGG